MHEREVVSQLSKEMEVVAQLPCVCVCVCICVCGMVNQKRKTWRLSHSRHCVCVVYDQSATQDMEVVAQSPPLCVCGVWSISNARHGGCRTVAATVCVYRVCGVWSISNARHGGCQICDKERQEKWRFAVSRADSTLALIHIGKKSVPIY
jgi:hypothetical protein